MAPLKAVDGAEVADFAVGETDAVEVFTGGVAVPDFYTGGGEGEGGGAAGDEPEELGDDSAEEDAFSGEEGEDGSGGLGGVGGGPGEGEAEGGGGEDGKGACSGSMVELVAVDGDGDGRSVLHTCLDGARPHSGCNESGPGIETLRGVAMVEFLVHLWSLLLKQQQDPKKSLVSRLKVPLAYERVQLRGVFVH